MQDKKHTMQLYVEKATIEALDGGQFDIYLEGYDIGQVVAEHNTRHLLEAMEFSDVADYVFEMLDEKKREEKDGE